MNFGQALAALLNGAAIGCANLERESSLVIQTPTGMVTEAFIVQMFPNGEVWIYEPTQADILATNWTISRDAKQPATQALHEHAGTTR